MLRADNGSSALVADTPQVAIAPLNVQSPSFDLDLTATMSFLVVSGLVVLGALCFLALRCVPALMRASCEYQSATSGTSIPSGAARNGNGLELTTTTSATSPDCGMAQVCKLLINQSINLAIKEVYHIWLKQFHLKLYQLRIFTYCCCYKICCYWIPPNIVNITTVSLH